MGADESLADIHKLCACHDCLLAHTTAVFDHLMGRWRDVFNVEFDVLHYDLTSTCFERNPPFARDDAADLKSVLRRRRALASPGRGHHGLEARAAGAQCCAHTESGNGVDQLLLVTGLRRGRDRPHQCLRERADDAGRTDLDGLRREFARLDTLLQQLLEHLAELSAADDACRVHLGADGLGNEGMGQMRTFQRAGREQLDSDSQPRRSGVGSSDDGVEDGHLVRTALVSTSTNRSAFDGK